MSDVGTGCTAIEREAIIRIPMATVLKLLQVPDQFRLTHGKEAVQYDVTADALCLRVASDCFGPSVPAVELCYVDGPPQYHGMIVRG